MFKEIGCGAFYAPSKSKSDMFDLWILISAHGVRTSEREGLGI